MASDRSLISLLRAHLAPRRRALAAVTLLQIVQTLALLTLPSLNADIIDYGVLGHHTGAILRSGALMVGLSAVQGALMVAAVRVGSRTAMSVGGELRERLYRQVQLLSPRQVEQFGVSSLTTRATNDVQQVQGLVLALTTVVVTAPVTAIGGVAMALRQDAALSLVMLALLPVLTAAVAIPVRRMRPLSATVQERIDAVNRVLREQIAGVRVIRAFVRQDLEARRFERVNGGLADAAVRLGRSSTQLVPFVVTSVNVFSVAAVAVVGPRLAHGHLHVGAVTAFLTYLVMVQTAIISTAFVITGLPRAEASAARMAEVLRTEPDMAAPDEAVGHMPEPGLVRLRGVRFRYPGAEQEVLCGIDFVARPGTTTAVVGSTGSGKSTLLSLACRLADASEGTVAIGGVDVRQLDPALLSSSLALVPQRPHLFSGTVASNLRLGQADATDDELWHALEVAQAAGFVRRMESGLAAEVRQGGSNLSGGQRQRLSIARALIHRPDIYLFDDAFSALDFATEAAVRSALNAETVGATVIIVAQRLSTVLDADHIVVLDGGIVAGAGTHAELLARSQVYQEIAQSQLEVEVAQ